jgi:signal transduction histidine kinase
MLMKQYIEQLLSVPALDPDDARRRRLLNILLLGILVASLVGLLAVVMNTMWEQHGVLDSETRILLGGIVVVTIGIFGIYQINRRSSGRIAALLFLLLLVVLFPFMDTPRQIVEGRSLFLFTLPIAIASLILLPSASFLFAVLSALILTGISITNNIFPNIPAITGLFMLALVSWLSARSLEQTLAELRNINTNLDQVVHERTQALAESLERERIEAGRSQAILNSIADGVIVFDRQWNATLANPAVRGMLEIPIELIIDKNFRELIEHPRLQPKSRGLLYAMMEQDTQPIGFRIEWGGKTLSVSAAQVYNRTENMGTVTVFRDFTREAEVEKLKSTFVAIVSHELRTPLNAILGYAEMFKEQVYGPMNEKQINMADRVMSNTQRLLGLINDLLNQAQMEAGKLAIKMAPFRPTELLDNLHAVTDKAAADKRLQLTSEIDSNLPPIINGDAERLNQILVNLVNNAIKFTDKGRIHVKLFQPYENKWGIEVSDTGVGIPESELPYVFDTFRQVEGTATRVHGGFGLGLSIVKQLVTLMNGEIKVRSTVDEGTTFIVTLPLVIPEPLTRIGE